MTLDELRELASAKLATSVRLHRLRNICDLKPAYGLIFEEFTHGYEYWAFGDEDVLYGDVDGILGPHLDGTTDLVIPGTDGKSGHLTLLRNHPRANELGRLSTTANGSTRTTAGKSLLPLGKVSAPAGPVAECRPGEERFRVRPIRLLRSRAGGRATRGAARRGPRAGAGQRCETLTSQRSRRHPCHDRQTTISTCWDLLEGPLEPLLNASGPAEAD